MNDGIGVFIGVAGVVIAAFSVALAYSQSKRQQKKQDSEESKEDGGQQATIKADIDYIKRRTDDTLLEVRDMRKCQSDYTERLARCEESTKSAHHRIDGMEAKLK